MDEVGQVFGGAGTWVGLFRVLFRLSRIPKFRMEPLPESHDRKAPVGSVALGTLRNLRLLGRQDSRLERVVLNGGYRIR